MQIHKKTIILLISFGCVVKSIRKPAFIVWKKYRNKLNLNLISEISEEKKFLGINWFIEYEKKEGEKSWSNKAKWEPLMRISAVTDKEIFLKKYHKEWFNLSKENITNRQMRPVFSTIPLNPITAYRMDNNQSLVTIVLKNLTMMTFNLSQRMTTKNGSKMIHQLAPIKSFYIG